MPSSDATPLTVLVGEDSTLFREGLVRILDDEGFTVVAAVGDADALVTASREHHPDVVVTDIRMPPTMSDDGVTAAAAMRAERPHQPVVLLSAHIEVGQAVSLVTQGSFGYLLKDRVLDVTDFTDAVRRVANGGTALDPDVVAVLVARTPPQAGLQTLSPRELEVLSLVAEGRSNTAIAAQLFVAERTVEAHMRSIFTKLDLDEDADTNRRVTAVLHYLRAVAG